MQVIYRNTKQRRKILEILNSTKEHPTAEWIYSKLKNQLPNLSLGTVYRNLKILQKQGAVASLRGLDTSDRFERQLECHHHFLCTKCGKIFDVNIPTEHMHSCCSQISESLHCEICGCEIRFIGTCKECQQ